MDGGMGGGMNRQMDSWMEGRKEGRKEGWMKTGWRELNPLVPLTFWCPRENLQVPPASQGPIRHQFLVSRLTSTKL